MSLEPQRIPFDLSLDAVPDSKIYISSGVLHLNGSLGFFKCGRKITRNYMRMSVTMHLPLISQFVTNVQKHQNQIDASYEQAHQNACKRDMQRILEKRNHQLYEHQLSTIAANSCCKLFEQADMSVSIMLMK